MIPAEPPQTFFFITINKSQMTPQQKKVLDDAAKDKLKNEAVLSGGSKYLNPIRKPKPKAKKGFWAKLFS